MTEEGRVHWITYARMSGQDEARIRNWKLVGGNQGTCALSPHDPIPAQPTQKYDETPYKVLAAGETFPFRVGIRTTQVPAPPPLPPTPSPRRARKTPSPPPRAPQPSPAASPLPPPTPTMRTFVQVDDSGNPITKDGRAVKYKLSSSSGGPIDVVRKIVHRTLQQEMQGVLEGGGGHTPHTLDMVPGTVKNAVAQAVRQNFMCNCPDSQCRKKYQCMQRSKEQGAQYLAKYMKDAPHIFLHSATVRLQEEGGKRPGVRVYEGSYRLINNPSKHCIKYSINKEVIAKYVNTLPVKCK